MFNKTINAKEVTARFKVEVLKCVRYKLPKNWKSKTTEELSKRAGSKTPILGPMPRQMNIDTGVKIVDKILEDFDARGIKLEPGIIHLRTPIGKRKFVSTTLNQMAYVDKKSLSGEDVILLARSVFKDLFVISKQKRQNVYVAAEYVGPLFIGRSLELANTKNAIQNKAHENYSDFLERLSARIAEMGCENFGEAWAKYCAEIEDELLDDEEA